MSYDRVRTVDALRSSLRWHRYFANAHRCIDNAEGVFLRWVDGALTARRGWRNVKRNVRDGWGVMFHGMPEPEPAQTTLYGWPR